MKQPEHIPGGPIFSFLIPLEPRRYAGQRWVKVLARSAHIVLCGIHLGAWVFQVETATRMSWAHAALLSGLLMVCLDLYESGAFMLQLRGLVVGGKVALLAMLPFFGSAAPWILAFVAIISVVSSHASSNFRYYLIWGRGKIQAAESKG